MVVFWNEEQLEDYKEECRKETLEELITKAEEFGGIVPISVLRNMLENDEDEV